MALVPPTVGALGSSIVDYFFIAGISSDDVQIALKEGISVDDLSAVVLDRYPEVDRSFPDSDDISELPLGAPIFCFPVGFNAYVEGESSSSSSSSESMGKGKFHSFVLTGGDGGRSYGACLQFYEKHTDGNVVVVVPKVFCVMSQYGYFSMFQKFLESLYRTYVLGIIDESDEAVNNGSRKNAATTTTTATAAAAATTTTTPAATSKIPFEGEIYRFVMGCSLPQRGYGISYPLGYSGERTLRYCCSVGPPAGFPDVDDSCFRCLFDCLSAENLIFVVSAVLLEQRVLLHSENLDTLNKCAEALIALLFPLCWQHVYVPLLPTQLLEYLSAPVCIACFFAFVFNWFSIIKKLFHIRYPWSISFNLTDIIVFFSFFSLSLFVLLHNPDTRYHLLWGFIQVV